MVNTVIIIVMKQITNVTIIHIVGYTVAQIALLCLTVVLTGISVVVMERTVGLFAFFFTGDLNVILATIFWACLLFGGFGYVTESSKKSEMSFWHKHLTESWTLYCLIAVGAISTIKTYTLLLNAHMQDISIAPQIGQPASIAELLMAYLVSISILAVIVNMLATCLAANRINGVSRH